MRTQEDWIQRYKEKMPYEALLMVAALDLVSSISNMSGVMLEEINGVVGPQTEATKLAEFISLEIMASTGKPCFWMSPAKAEVNGKKSMFFSHEELDLLPDQMVLLCEDVITTGGSVDLTADAVTSADGLVLPYITSLVNRSGLREANGRTIVALIDRPMPMWVPGGC